MQCNAMQAALQRSASKSVHLVLRPAGARSLPAVLPTACPELSRSAIASRIHHHRGLTVRASATDNKKPTAPSPFILPMLEGYHEVESIKGIRLNMELEKPQPEYLVKWKASTSRCHAASPSNFASCTQLTVHPTPMMLAGRV